MDKGAVVALYSRLVRVYHNHGEKTMVKPWWKKNGEGLSRVLPAGNAATFVELMFRDFDKDSNGHLDFQVSL